MRPAEVNDLEKSWDIPVGVQYKSENPPLGGVFVSRFGSFLLIEIWKRGPMRTTSGFTLLELLIVIGMIGALSAIGFASMGGLRRSQDLEQATANLSQQIQRARAQSMSTSTVWRVRITDGDTFVLEQDTSTTATPTWTTRSTTDLRSGMTFSNTAGDTMSFNTRGIGSFSNGAGAFSSSTSDFRIKVDGSEKLIMTPSILGAVRTAKLQ
jgi:prepilin-type N-terminal cleavage/methylation domain-containing protein